MAGVEADLTLDSRQAQAAVAALERQIDAASSIVLRVDTSAVPPAVSAAIAAADSQVVVTGDADALTGEVTGAVDAADTEVLVTGDASQVTGEVTGAVDAADSNVIVTGDASQVTGAVTSAVDAADTNVVVTADSSGLAGVTDQSDALNASLIASTQSGVNLRSVLATGATAAAVAGLGALVNAASDLEQAVGGTTAVFGEAQGVVVDFARGAAEAAGLSEEAARRLTSQIGGLLQGFQFTQQEAAATSVQLAQLGADLAATFGGNPEEAVQALGAALRGEFDPLERYGVSLNITQANLRAVELGLADSTSEVSLNARAQASLSLIMERSAQAQGQFARESETAAGQLERAKAEATNAAAAVGAALLPAFVDLLGSLRTSVLPTLQELGEVLGPALGRILQAAGPLIEGFGTGLQALVPIATALAAVMEAIPEPVLQLLGTFLALRAAAGPLTPVLSAVGTAIADMLHQPQHLAANLDGATGATGRFRNGLSNLIAGINPATAAMAAAAIVATGLANDSARAAERKRELKAEAEGLRSALLSEEGAIEGVTQQLVQMAEQGEVIQNVFGAFGDLQLDKVLGEAGISAQEFAEGLADTEQPLNDLIDDLKAQGDEASVAGQGLEELAQRYNEQAEAALRAGVTTERWTQNQVDAALAANENADGSTNAVAALDQLSSAETAAAEAAEAQTQALTEQQKALQELLASEPRVALLFTALSEGSGRTTTNLASFAVAAADAGLSAEQLNVLLAQLGGGGPQAQAALQAVADTITGLRDAAAGTLPTLSEIAGAADEFSLQGFRDQLADAYGAIVGFNENLGLIAEQGGPRLAAAAAQLGPEFAAGIAQGIRDGNPEVVAEAELLLAGIEQAGTDTSSLITGTIGPNLAVATGQMGTAAAAAFGQGFVLDASGQIIAVETQVQERGPGVRTRAEEMGAAAAGGFVAGFTPDAGPGVAGATGGINAGAPGVAGAAGAAGAAGTGAFETNFTPDPGPAIEQARALVDRGAAAMAQAGFQLGDQAVRGFRAGTDAWGGVAAGVAASAAQQAGSARGVASSVGYGIGAALGAGIAEGIADWTSTIARNAVNAVNQAAAQARRAAQIASPSKVFAEIGEQMGAGMAVGLDESATAVAAAAASLTDAAAVAASQGSLTVGGLDPAAAAVAAVQAGVAPTGGSGDIIVQVAPGAVVISGTVSPTEDVTRAAGQLATVLGRQLKLAARSGG